MTTEKNILVNRKFDGAQEKADVRLITETEEERSWPHPLRKPAALLSVVVVSRGQPPDEVEGVEAGLASGRGGPASWAARGAGGETSACDL